MSEEQLATVKTAVAQLFEHTPQTTPDGGFMASFAWHVAMNSMAATFPPCFDKHLLLGVTRALAEQAKSDWAAMAFEAWWTEDQGLARELHEAGGGLNDLEEGDPRRTECVFITYQPRGGFPSHSMAEILRAPDGACLLREWRDMPEGGAAASGNMVTIFPIETMADA